MSAARLDRIDTLRGIAVFGIWQVNIYACIFGTSMFRFGVLGEGASAIEQALVFLAVALVEQKFYPIFAFLFGAGFALQTRRKNPALAAGTYHKRMQWLLVCGILHGTLIWFGDILTIYALTGFWLAGKAGVRLRKLIASLRTVIIANIILAVVMTGIYLLGGTLDAAGVKDELLSVARTSAVYTQGSWGEIARMRIDDYFITVISGLFYLPRFALLFLLGALAVRLGWLTRPARYACLWRRIMLFGFAAGLPLNLLCAWFAWRASVSATADSMSVAIGDLVGPVLASAYIASAMLAGPRIMAVLSSCFGAAGRMPLTNYLMQSLIFTMLLQGVGLGLGALIPRALWPVLALFVMACQIVFSRVWMANFRQGPMEALWRRYYQ